MDCNLKNTIPKFEGNFRATCSSILNPRRPPLQVNLVTVTAYPPTVSSREMGRGHQHTRRRADGPRIVEILDADINDSEPQPNVYTKESQNENHIMLYSVGHKAATREMCKAKEEVPFKHILHRLKGWKKSERLL